MSRYRGPGLSWTGGREGEREGDGGRDAESVFKGVSRRASPPVTPAAGGAGSVIGPPKLPLSRGAGCQPPPPPPPPWSLDCWPAAAWSLSRWSAMRDRLPCGVMYGPLSERSPWSAVWSSVRSSAVYRAKGLFLNWGTNTCFGHFHPPFSALCYVNLRFH